LTDREFTHLNPRADRTREHALSQSFGAMTMGLLCRLQRR
jgi:hypothetical protein